MASSRYRSQVFQAFSRQTRRLSDRLGQTWRQTKLTATWGTQILLYPIYALFQGTRVVSRQIGQTVQRILPQLQPAAAADPANPPIDELADLDAPVDTPIVRSLLAVAGLELSELTPILPAADGALVTSAAAPIVVVDLPGAISIQDGQAIAPTENRAIEPAIVRVRGIASLLSDRRLVLTTIHNQLLDVLTAGQQNQLRQRIVWELASYQRLLRLRSTAIKPLPLPADSPNLLPPVRLLRRLVAWMQTSPIAIATNLFGEAALPPVLPPAAPAVPAAPRLISPSRFLWLDRLLERLNPSIASSPVASRSWPQQLQQFFHPPSVPESAESSSLAIADSADLVSTRPAASKRDRWWKRKRLAASFPGQPPIATRGQNPSALPPVGTPRPLVTIRKSGDRLSEDAASSALAVESEPTELAAAPTWIETEARLVGYVKHPLEQLLEWLDTGMLWLETTLSNFWHWISGQPH